jgi:predicted Zn-dependent peptidase
MTGELESKIFHMPDEITLTAIPVKKFKTVNAALLARDRLSRENATKNALAPRVLRRGSERYPSSQAINARADAMYGAAFEAGTIKKGEEQITQIYTEVLSGVDNGRLVFDGLDFMGDIFLNPLGKGEKAFREDFVNGEKEALRRIIEGRADDKQEYAKLRLIEIMFRDAPFGVYGDGYAEDIDAIDAAGLFARYEEIAARSPLDFIMIGDFDPEAAAEKISDLFCGARKPPANVIEKAEPFSESRAENIVRERAAVAQAKLCAGISTGAPNKGQGFYDLLVMNAIFGVGTESKLFLNAREKENLCYYISSAAHRFKSVISVACGVDASDANRAVELIKSLLESVKTGDFSDGDLDGAKNALAKQYEQTLDDPAGVMDYYLSERLSGGDTSIRDAIEAVMASTREGVVKAAENAAVDTVYILEGDASGNEN